MRLLKRECIQREREKKKIKEEGWKGWDDKIQYLNIFFDVSKNYLQFYGYVFYTCGSYTNNNILIFM